MIPRHRRSRRQSLLHATTAIAVVVLLLFVFLGAGYIYLLPTDRAAPEEPGALAVLARHEARWRAARPGRVRYTVVRQCYCPRPVVEPYVATEDGVQRSARFREPLVDADGTMTAPPEPLWIDDLFGEIRAALADGRRVDVEYDARYGYPARVNFRSDDAAAERRIAVRDFRVLPAGGT